MCTNTGQSLFHYFIIATSFLVKKKVFLTASLTFLCSWAKHFGCLCAWAVKRASQLWLSKSVLDLETGNSTVLLNKTGEQFWSQRWLSSYTMGWLSIPECIWHLSPQAPWVEASWCFCIACDGMGWNVPVPAAKSQPILHSVFPGPAWKSLRPSSLGHFWRRTKWVPGDNEGLVTASWWQYSPVVLIKRPFPEAVSKEKQE